MAGMKRQAIQDKRPENRRGASSLTIFGARTARSVRPVAPAASPTVAREEWEKIEERYHHLIGASHEWMWEVDRHGRYTYVSARCRDLLGYQPEELIGKTPYDLMPPTEARRVKRLFNGIARRREAFQRLENLNRHKAGRLVTLETNGRPIIDRHGRFQGYRGLDRDITEHKQVEEALRSNEARLRQVIDASPVPLSVDDMQGHIEYLNRTFVEKFGYAHRELPTSAAWFARAYPDPAYRRQVARRWKDCLRQGRREGGEVGPLEVAVTCKDGSVRTVEFIGTPLGHRLLIAARDLTARKRTESALQDNLRFLHTLLNAIASPVFYKDTAGRYLGCNQAFELLLGVPRARIIGKTVFEVAPSDLAEEYHRADLKLMKKRGVQIYEGSVAAADGTRHEFIFHKATFEDADGRVAGLIGAMLDITGRKRAEELLRESEERYRRLVEVSPDAICINRQNRLVFVNNAGLRLFGATCQSQLLGKSSFDLFHSDYHPIIKHRRHQMLQFGQAVPLMEAKIVRLHGGTRDVEVAAAPFEERGGTAILVVLHDITERKRLEKEILDIADREQQRIGQDLHDGLCQYLSGAKFRSSLLEHKLKDKNLAEAEEAKAIEELLSTAIHQARNIARGLHPVLLEGQGLMSALEELARATTAVYDINCVCRCRQAVLVYDHVLATQLYRIAQEAIHNAIHHGRARKVGLGLRTCQGRIILTIQDDGIGLPRRQSRKTGMGLRNMRYRARTIGGTLDVRRGPNRGTTVTCWLRSPEAKLERRTIP